MHIHRQPVAVAVKIKMDRQDRRYIHRSYLFVEGDDDARFYQRAIDHSACKIEAHFGVNRVLDALESCRQMRVGGVLAVIDRDNRSDAEVSQLSSHQDLVVTETRDFETMMIRSPALSALISEVIKPSATDYQDPETIANWVRSYVLKAATPLGLLRNYSQSRNLGWSFQQVARNAHIFIVFERQSPAVNIEKMVRLVSRSDDVNLEAVNFIRDGLAKMQMPWRVVQGHDCVTLLQYILPVANSHFSKSHLGNPGKYDSVIRAAFAAELTSTHIYQFFLHWQNTHTPYRVLPAGRTTNQ